MVSLLVDTVSFEDAGGRAAALAESVDRAMSSAASGLGRLPNMAGSDPNGLRWADAYDQAAGQIFSSMTQWHDGVATLARKLAVTGYYYEVAELSNAGDSAVGLALPAPITESTCRALASAAGGHRVFPNPNPAFHWVAEQIGNLIGDMWPDGDTRKLDEASRVWHRLADDLDDIASSFSTVMDGLDGIHTPELPRIDDSVHRLRAGAKKLAAAARHLGTACNTLSGEIAHVHLQTEITLGITIVAITATVAAALGLTVFTFGISDAVGVAGVAGETAGAVATITGFIAEFAATLSAGVGGIATAAAGLLPISAELAAGVGVVIGDITASAVVWGAAGAVEDVGITAITQPGSDLGEAAEQGFIGGALGGAVGGGLGKGVELARGGVSVSAIDGVTALKLTQLRSPVENLAEARSPFEVQFSQKSVSFHKIDRETGEHYTYDDLESSMRTNGWKGAPIDVVDFGEHGVTSADNTRVLAAREAGIDILVMSHQPGDALTESEVRRFSPPGRVRVEARTWEEALRIRIHRQGANWSSQHPHGTHELPKITGRSQ